MTDAVDLIGVGIPPNPAQMVSNMVNGQAVGLELTATSYTVGVSDFGKLIIFSAGTAVTVTIPANLPFPLTFKDPRPVVQFLQYGAGTVTVTAGGGVTLNPATATANQYAIIGIVSVSSNIWVGFGALA